MPEMCDGPMLRGLQVYRMVLQRVCIAEQNVIQHIMNYSSLCSAFGGLGCDLSCKQISCIEIRSRILVVVVL